MPYPNEHACRLEDPGQFDKLRRNNCGEKSDGKCIDVIYGIKDGKSKIQALRYGKEIWSASAAREHCKGRGGRFEAAAEEKNNMENELETRMFENIEFRETGENKPPVIVGYAAVFNKLSANLGGFREQIKPGAFTRTLKDVEGGKRVVNSFFNHDRNWLLATTNNGSLRLKEDEKGLWVEMEPILTTLNGHPINLIRAKAVTGMSFMFRVEPDGKDSWEYKRGKETIRTLIDVDLFDVCPVVEPAYPQTSVKVRDYLNAIKEAEIELDVQGAPGAGRVDSLGKSRLNYGYPIRRAQGEPKK